MFWLNSVSFVSAKKCPYVSVPKINQYLLFVRQHLETAKLHWRSVNCPESLLFVTGSVWTCNFCINFGSYFVEPFCIRKCMQHLVRLTKKVFCSGKPLQVPSAQLCPVFAAKICCYKPSCYFRRFPVRIHFLHRRMGTLVRQLKRLHPTYFCWALCFEKWMTAFRIAFQH